ncbi:calcium/sodium antiporter [Bizionia sediminis]|uniref:Calcium/sodium antiporter n=1 Tax=Bizionia sediminis TaxID=1737064 RepID=A0ABW5KUT0_9FLAO
MLLAFLLIFLGFASLIFGANGLVTGASWLAKKNKVSDLVIGLTIVAFGTSAPELVVNSVAAFNGFSDIVFANIIGSNNFNLFVILGVAGLIYPITVQSSTAWKEIPLSLLVAVLLLALANNFFVFPNPQISRLDGLALGLIFLGFMYYVFRQLQRETTPTTTIVQQSTLKIWMFIVLGMVGLLIGGKLVVSNSIAVATQLGISQKVIGITIIAAGTSLPELVTSVVAAFKKNSDIAIGNVIGSNIFNMLFVLAISALINPVAYSVNFNLDLLILIGGTLFLLLGMFTGTRKRLDRWEAGVLLLCYVVYTAFILMKEVA